MSALYWITRLDGLNVVALALLVVGVVTTSILFVLRLASESDGDKSVSDVCKKGLKFSTPALVVGVLMTLFLPTTKEALLIWGVGGTIDYLESNETARKIPDKCIKALDKFISDYIPDNQLKNDSINEKTSN